MGRCLQNDYGSQYFGGLAGLKNREQNASRQEGLAPGIMEDLNTRNTTPITGKQENNYATKSAKVSAKAFRDYARRRITIHGDVPIEWLCLKLRAR